MTETTPEKPPEEGVDSGRRDFVRKAAYTAPALIALGFAAHSRNAQGSNHLPPPPSAPVSQGVSDDINEEDVLLDQAGRQD